LVSEAEDSGRNEQVMDPCIELFRMLYADDMEARFGFTKRPNDPSEKLPVMLAIALLLNPLYGGTCALCTLLIVMYPIYNHSHNLHRWLFREAMHHSQWFDDRRPIPSCRA
jgi:hypothetical protein